MNKREIWGSVIAGIAGAVIAGVGSVWALSREVVTRTDAREIAKAVMNERDTAVLQRISSVEAKMDMLLEIIRQRGRND